MNEKINTYDLAIQDLKDQLVREQNKNVALNENLHKLRSEHKYQEEALNDTNV